uniref:Delta-aminolevulinic acid dehydratase n=2 Tax=Leersia perrieri TaxID=77586 RepID=A0A0D9WTW1_9ORYZ
MTVMVVGVAIGRTEATRIGLSSLYCCCNSSSSSPRLQAMASTVSFSPANVQMLQGRSCHSHAAFGSCSAVPRAGARLRSTAVRVSSEQEAAVRAPSGRSIEECEADAVAGKFPAPPPLVRPKAPEGTPQIRPLDLTKRPRRNRRSPALRSAFQETTISPANLVLPLFIHEGEEDAPIGAMPGCYRLGWRHGLLDESQSGDEAYNDNGLVPRTIRLLKDKFPDIVVYTDVALDPYSSDGHDGIVREDGVIMNDETVYQLCKQAVSQARAGADVVSPSDMMDGRVGAIRAALDAEGFHDVSIMSYTAKYASSFYGPFREALDSNPRFGDKKTYQMNPANYREALIETREDEKEGADILLVKPGLPYLDVIRLLRDQSSLPIAAYQVSGEYSMIKAGGALNMIDEEKVMMESLMCLRRAGADIILTYFARQAATVLCGMRPN